jgi:DHA1 family bicyclomycin/chloramphenicol resistance-like MFS transporter
MNKKIGFFVPVTLGMLTAFGPFVTDFYLPAMPEMVGFFHTSPSMVSMSLTAGMIGLAAGQVLIGPLSDRYGRKPLLIISMLAFSLASVLCIFAPNIYVFNLLRIFQGFAGAGGIVLSKSIATDMFTGRDLTNFMALLGAINGIAPVAAPIVGGTMTNFTTWQGIFCLLLVIGIILLVCSCRLKETLQPDKRIKENLVKLYGNLFRVFLNRRFCLSTLASMASFFTFFAYISSSPFIFQKIYGLSAFEFSLCFGLNAFTIGIGAAVATRFHHQNTALKWASIDLMASTLLVAACQVLHSPLAILMPCYIYMLISFGLMQPVSTSLALDSERENAGAASAMFGASGFVAGAVASPIVASGNLLWSSSIVMLIGAALCLAITLPLCANIKREAMGK